MTTRQMQTAAPEHRSPVDPAVTVVNAENEDLRAELAYRNAGGELTAKTALRDRADSYSRDAQAFAAGIDGITAEDCKRYAVTYRTIAGELRKIAADL